MTTFLAHFPCYYIRSLRLPVVLALYSFEHEVQPTEARKDKTFNQVVPNTWNVVSGPYFSKTLVIGSVNSNQQIDVIKKKSIKKKIHARKLL